MLHSIEGRKLNRKAVSGIVLLLLLTSMLPSTFTIQSVEAEPETWIVDDDGPADFSTIQAAINAADAGDTIIVRAGIYIENVWVDKNRLTFISEAGPEETIVQSAIYLGVIFAVTANYVNIDGFTFRKGDKGIALGPSFGSIIQNNICESNWENILLGNSENNIVKNNTCTDGGYGIRLSFCDNNIIEDNRCERNYNFGLSLDCSSSNNVAFHNNFVDNGYGVAICDSSNNNTVSTNSIIASDQAGIQIDESSGNTISANTITDTLNWWGILLSGFSRENSIVENDITANNHDGVGLFDSSSNTIIGNNITANGGNLGVFLAYSSNNTLAENNVTDNWNGIALSYSSENTIAENSITNNQNGIELRPYSSDNVIHHNDFINNAIQVNIWSAPTPNVWDDGYPSGGNYWSDYEERYPDATEIDDSGVWDTPYVIDENNQDNYPLVEPRVHVAGKPDFTIAKINPVQVVWNSDINDDCRIDLVAGKSTMVRVKVGMNNIESLDKTNTVDLLFQMPEYKTGDFIIPQIWEAHPSIEYLEENEGIVDFYIRPPTLIGDSWIRVSIDPENEIEEIDETNNVDTIEVTVKDTRDLRIAFFRIERSDYGVTEWEEYEKTAEGSSEFIQAVYPISEAELTCGIRREAIQGHAKLPFRLGIRWDCSELATRAKRLGYDIGIAIVPRAYFDYHGISASGTMFNSVKGAAIVQEGENETSAHEVGHMYGLEHGDPNTAQATGFWVTRKQPIENPLYLDFMTGSLWVWISNENYAHLFQQFGVDKEDPEILLVSGDSYENGTIRLEEWYWVEEGRDDLDKIVPGDYSIQILDEGGNILDEISFRAEFYMYACMLGIIELDFAPFTFAIPYPKSASVVKVLHGEETKVEVELAAKLLDDVCIHGRLAHEYDILIESVETADIPEEVKSGLLDKLNSAKMKAEQGLAHIFGERYTTGKNTLNSASNIIAAFVNQVNAQLGDNIPEEDANGFISWAQGIILNLQNQIVYALETEQQ